MTKKRGLTLPLQRRRGTPAPEPKTPPEAPYKRPRWRADCEDGPRPCPFVGCRYHLALTVRQNALSLSVDSIDQLAQLVDTCALDVADRGEHSGPEVARLLGVSRQRVARLEQVAVAKLGAYFRALEPAVVKQIMPLLLRMLAQEGEEH